MKFALITAPNGFDLVRRLNLSYHLVLAQYLGDLDYIGFYRDRHRKGDFIIVDNGAAELGQSIPFETILYRAQLVGADEIVLPDVLDDGEATYQASAAVAWRVPTRQRAVVPQGRNWTEWTSCLESLIGLGCTTICIAKRYERLPGGRASALAILAQMSLLSGYNVHLLGFDYNPLEEAKRALTFYPEIRGVDSAAPIAYAQEARSITSLSRSSYQWGQSFDAVMAWQSTRMLLNVCNFGEDTCI
jgi:hypothetical protein